jgi:hypothetical protein
MMHIKLRIIIFFIGGLFLTSFASAQSSQQVDQLQNMSAAELSTVNVDNLSDQQIRKYLDQLANSGYSQAEVEMALKARGLPQAQIDKLKQRIARLQRGAVKEGTGYSRIRTREADPPSEDDLVGVLTDDFEQVLEREDLAKQRRVFGYKLFNSESLTFEPNLNIPTPKDYLLGSGDEVIIDVWGASEQTYQEVISPEGYIRIPNLGPIYLNGLSMERASERIKQRLTKIYSGLALTTRITTQYLRAGVIGPVAHHHRTCNRRSPKTRQLQCKLSV